MIISYLISDVNMSIEGKLHSSIDTTAGKYIQVSIKYQGFAQNIYMFHVCV